MTAQVLIVGLIVMACMAYVVWTLMPATLRRAFARVVLRLSLPALVLVHRPQEGEVEENGDRSGIGQREDPDHGLPSVREQGERSKARRRGR